MILYARYIAQSTVCCTAYIYIYMRVTCMVYDFTLQYSACHGSHRSHHTSIPCMILLFVMISSGGVVLPVCSVTLLGVVLPVCSVTLLGVVLPVCSVTLLGVVLPVCSVTLLGVVLPVCSVTLLGISIHGV